MPTTLRSRCAAFLGLISHHDLSVVDNLVAFVVAETGRSADARLDQSLPLCLYFSTKADREEFIQIYHEAKPHAVVKKI